MTSEALTAVLLTALVVANTGVARAQRRQVGSLCRAPEATLFTCEVETKVVSICGQEQSPAVYRFGRPGQIELALTNLHLAERALAGGGETQVYADTPTYRHIVYDRVVRTSFDGDGRHGPQAESGLVVQRGGRTVSSRQCAAPATFDRLTRALVPASDYVPH